MNPPKKQPALRGYGGVLAVLFAVLVVGAAVVAVSDQAGRHLILSLVRQPETYTELYFSEDEPLLVDTGDSGEVAVTVSFVVVNHEGRTSQYPYAVQVLGEADLPVAQMEGLMEIADGSSSTATVTIEVPEGAPWLAVNVRLLGRAEHIRFLRSTLETPFN